jgi:hypothetical protein
MGDAKIEIKVGAVSFSGEGDGKWLSEQLDKMLQKIPELARVAPAHGGGAGEGSGGATMAGKARGTLASFLSAKNARSNKTRKFLATAVWLHDNADKSRLVTGNVTKALSQHNQGSCGNASQCLNDNAKKGFVFKDGKEFYVTEEGRREVG